MRMFTMDGRFYLEAWCRRAEGMRVFRLDRIENARLLDEPARPPAEAHLRDLSEGVYTPAPEHLLVVCGSTRIRLGGGLLPGDRGHARSGTASARSACGLRIRPGCGRSSSVRPGRSKCCRRSGWLSRWPPRRPQRSTRTRRSSRPHPGGRSKVCGVWWVVAIAWGAALIVAVVVLGSCLYELSWKSERLRKDVALLTDTEAGAHHVAGPDTHGAGAPGDPSIGTLN